MDLYIRRYDDIPATHVLHEMLLPPGWAAQMGGYLFVCTDVAKDLGDPDDTVTIADRKWPAWKMGTARATGQIEGLK